MNHIFYLRHPLDVQCSEFSASNLSVGIIAIQLSACDIISVSLRSYLLLFLNGISLVNEIDLAVHIIGNSAVALVV